MPHIATKEFDNEYLRVLRDVLIEGSDTEQVRTKHGRRRLPHQHMKFDISQDFPLLTTKKVNYKAAFNELVWMVCLGSTDVKWLNDQGHTFWDEWKLDDGTIGKGYGKQFRNCKGVDQINSVLNSLKTDPYGSRHVISLWQPDEIEDMALPPCHGAHIQFTVTGNSLNLHMTMRSADMFLGVPFNIAFYALMCRIFAQRLGLDCGEFSLFMVDCHIYINHIEQVKEQLTRKPKPYPFLLINPAVHSINDYRIDDFRVVGYDSHPFIKAEVSV